MRTREDGRPDRDLGEFLRRTVEVPEPRDDLQTRLQAGIEAIDREEEASAHRRLSPRQWSPRRWAATLAAAAVVTAAVLALVGIPGVEQTSIPGATAADRVVAIIDDGLSRVNTLQGVYVLDDDVKRDDERTGIRTIRFAATTHGRRFYDVRYDPDWGAKQEDWRRDLKNDPAFVHDPDLLASDAATVRQIVVSNPGACLLQMKTWCVDPFTHKTIGVRYRFFRGLPLTALGPSKQVQQVWALSNELRTQLVERQPRVVLKEVVRDERSTYQAIIIGDDDKPAYEVLIDKEFGVAWQVRALAEPSRTSDEGPGVWLTPYHLERVAINKPIDPDLFVMKPDYRYAPSGFGRPDRVDTPEDYGVDFELRPFPVADLAAHTSSWTLLPTWIPAGYRLEQATTYPGDIRIWLTYRRGLNELEVGTWGGDAGPALERSLPAFVFQAAGGATFLDDREWPDVGSPVRPLQHGALAGWPAGTHLVLFGDRGRNDVWASLGSGVSGTLPMADLRKMVDSLHPVKPGPHVPEDDYEWQAWIALGAAVAVAPGVALLWWGRRGGGAPPPAPLPSLRVVRRPLVGVLLVVVGATFSWHRLYGEGNDFGVRGWHEPLGVAVVALALLAGAAAAWAPLAPPRPPIGPRFLTTLLGLFTLAGALTAIVYLPVKARFTVDAAAQYEEWGRLGQFADFLRSAYCPAPGPGLYLSIVGAALIVVGGLRMRVAHREPAENAG